jgi:hypothetical protein
MRANRLKTRAIVVTVQSWSQSSAATAIETLAAPPTTRARADKNRLEWAEHTVLGPFGDPRRGRDAIVGRNCAREPGGAS